MFTPGPAATLLIALLLYAAALVLLGRLGLWRRGLPHWLFAAGTWTLVVVFGARVVGDFRWVGLFKRVTGTPFAWWDTWAYVPLCALLASAALLVASLEPCTGFAPLQRGVQMLVRQGEPFCETNSPRDRGHSSGVADGLPVGE